MEENISMENQIVEETPVVQEEPLVTPAYEMTQEPPKKKKNLKPWLIAGISTLVVAAAVVLVLVFFVFNTYKTPVKLIEEVANAKKASAMYEGYANLLNGFCEDEYKEIMKILKKTEFYEDMIEGFEGQIEDNKDEYGSNYKLKYKIEEKEKIDKDDLKDVRDNMRDTGEEMLEDLNDLDDYDYEELADEMDISESQAKKVLKAEKEIAKILKKVKITEGYTLTLSIKTTGSELDDPMEDEMEINVYKINGRWVSDISLMVLTEILYMQ